MALNETPYIHSKATMVITTPSLDLSCMVRSVSLTASTTEIDLATQCAPGAAAPGVTTWTLAAELLVSFDSADAEGDGLWNQLNAIAGNLVTITIKPADATVDSTNPSAAFTMYMPQIDFINIATLGDKTVWSFSQKTASVPTFAVA